MRFSAASVGLSFALLMGVSTVLAAPIAKSNPDTCKDPFQCGALSARLAASDNDYPGAFRAIRRGCDMETKSPTPGDALFACEEYAQLLITAGTARGGDPAKGIAMLEQMCAARPVSKPGDVTPCNTLARDYDRPPKESGLPRRTDKAAALRLAECNHGDSLGCDSLGDMYLKGGPGFPADATKARAAMDKGCAMNDQYAAGVCGAIGAKLAEGKLGAPPDRKAAMIYLEKSCAQGYRCDLFVEFLLRDHRDDEAVKAFEKPRAFMMDKDAWAAKYCREGFKVMCNRPTTTRAKATASAGSTSPGY